MKLEIGFGSCPQTVELPDETVLDVLYPNGIEAPADSAAEVARALLSPIGTPPLAELAKGKQKVAIVTSDITRPMPSAVVLPLVLDELYRAGVCPESVTVVFALGSHRRQTEEEKLHLAGEEVYRPGNLRRFPGLRLRTYGRHEARHPGGYLPPGGGGGSAHLSGQH